MECREWTGQGDHAMAVKMGKLTSEAMKLSIKARARLAEQLILSLDAPPEAENLRLWVAEAERRLRDLRTGKRKEISARQVLGRARAAIA